MTDSPVKITVSVNVLDCRAQFTIVSLHVIKAYGEGEVQTHSYVAAALNESGQLHVVADLILGTVTCYPLSRRLGGPNNQSGRFREAENFFSYRESFRDITVVRPVL
jgi:hypothetical protein